MAELPGDLLALVEGATSPTSPRCCPTRSPHSVPVWTRARRRSARVLHPDAVAQGAQPRGRPARGDLDRRRREPVPDGPGAAATWPSASRARTPLRDHRPAGRRSTRRQPCPCAGSSSRVVVDRAWSMTLPFEHWPRHSSPDAADPVLVNAGILVAVVVATVLMIRDAATSRLASRRRAGGEGRPLRRSRAPVSWVKRDRLRAAARRLAAAARPRGCCGRSCRTATSRRCRRRGCATSRPAAGRAARP